MKYIKMYEGRSYNYKFNEGDDVIRKKDGKLGTVIYRSYIDVTKNTKPGGTESYEIQYLVDFGDGRIWYKPNKLDKFQKSIDKYNI